jgi:hypothetical protein
VKRRHTADTTRPNKEGRWAMRHIGETFSKRFGVVPATFRYTDPFRSD